MTSRQIELVLFDLSVILIVAQIFGAVARRLRQPAVVGEIVAGILLGPTLAHGAISDALFPTDVRPALTTVADLGVALFMFIIGLEVEGALLRGRRSATVSVAVAAVAVPFGLGLAVALGMAHSYPAGHRLAFVAFMGTAMSITAFPVLARILEERRLSRTLLGAFALGSAAIGDVLAWTMLAVVVSLADSGDGAPWRVAFVVPFVVVMFLFGRPLLARLIGDGPGDSMRTLSIVLAGLLGAAAFLEWTGLNFIFGAFLVGVIVPRGEDKRISTAIRGQLEKLSMLLLMPVFFVIAGLNVDLATLGLSGLGTLALILLVAVGGKVLGTLAGAGVAGISPRRSLPIAILMNTRGLTELVVLTTGVQLGILDHRTYSMMVVMALITTAMTGPLLTLAGVRPPAVDEAAPAVPAGSAESPTELGADAVRRGRGSS